MLETYILLERLASLWLDVRIARHLTLTIAMVGVIISVKRCLHRILVPRVIMMAPTKSMIREKRARRVHRMILIQGVVTATTTSVPLMQVATVEATHKFIASSYKMLEAILF